MKEHGIMMRKLARYSALVVVVVIVALIALGGWSRIEKAVGAERGQTKPSVPPKRKVLYWYDAMNPQIRYDKPGKAPDGMDLLPKYADEEAGGMEQMPAGTVKISAERQQLIGVRLGPVERRHLSRDIRAVAELTANETTLAHVHVKVNGWVEKVYVDFVGQLVKQNQPLFTLYSPDLVATQEEYLIARRGEQNLGQSSFEPAAEGARSLLRSTRERLKLWDISDDQIKKLDETGEVNKYMTFYSPVTGFVLDRKAFPGTAITPDTELYTIANLSTIWANAEVYQYEVPYVHPGQSAEMELSYFPGKTYRGRIDYVYPTVDPQTRTVKVRLEFPNPDFELKPDMFADVHLKIDYGDQLVIPESAILDSGERLIVFIAHDGGYFEPREIKAGSRVGESVIVLAGLRAGEIIVTSGNFLIDSESRLTSGMAGMKH